MPLKSFIYPYTRCISSPSSVKLLDTFVKSPPLQATRLTFTPHPSSHPKPSLTPFHPLTSPHTFTPPPSPTPHTPQLHLTPLNFTPLPFTSHPSTSPPPPFPSSHTPPIHLTPLNFTPPFPSSHPPPLHLTPLNFTPPPLPFISHPSPSPHTPQLHPPPLPFISHPSPSPHTLHNTPSSSPTHPPPIHPTPPHPLTLTCVFSPNTYSTALVKPLVAVSEERSVATPFCLIAEGETPRWRLPTGRLRSLTLVTRTNADNNTRTYSDTARLVTNQENRHCTTG